MISATKTIMNFLHLLSAYPDLLFSPHPTSALREQRSPSLHLSKHLRDHLSHGQATTITQLPGHTTPTPQHQLPASGLPTILPAHPISFSSRYLLLSNFNYLFICLLGNFLPPKIKVQWNQGLCFAPQGILGVQDGDSNMVGAYYVLLDEPIYLLIPL